MKDKGRQEGWKTCTYFHHQIIIVFNHSDHSEQKYYVHPIPTAIILNETIYHPYWNRLGKSGMKETTWAFIGLGNGHVFWFSHSQCSCLFLAVGNVGRITWLEHEQIPAFSPQRVNQWFGWKWIWKRTGLKEDQFGFLWWTDKEIVRVTICTNH